jgi:hypothetical protein
MSVDYAETLLFQYLYSVHAMMYEMKATHLSCWKQTSQTRDRQVPIHTCLGDPLTHEPWISALLSAVLCTDLRSALEMSQT